jgi:hypothetical protein
MRFPRIWMFSIFSKFLQVLGDVAKLSPRDGGAK